MHEIKLMASDETLYTVIGEIEKLLDENQCPETLKMIMLVAVEEIFVNIAHYAYGGKPGEAAIGLDVIPNPKSCRIVFRDRGVPYNPLEKTDPDITLSAEEREIGGLGIYMVKQSMDDINYEYKDGKNILSIKKKINEDQT